MRIELDNNLLREVDFDVVVFIYCLCYPRQYNFCSGYEESSHREPEEQPTGRVARYDAFEEASGYS